MNLNLSKNDIDMLPTPEGELAETSNMEFARKLPIPKQVKLDYPLSRELAQQKHDRDEEIRAIFRGESDKLILIIGPCSADAKEPVLEYFSRLSRVREQVKDKILIIPRLYANKPRTTGTGYKGILHQPDPNEKPDMYRGILSIRDLHLCALRDYGFTCADEMLYPENYRYISDIVSYMAVGARSVENQQHRLTASGIDLPVGMKNPTSGDLSVMMNAIYAAQHPHTFLYRGWEVHSKGNPYAHAILRGYMDFSGKYISNYHYENLTELIRLYADSGNANPSVIVDCNHANSGKRYGEQPRIASDVIHSCNMNRDIRRIVKGLMIESYLLDGSQDPGVDYVPGRSITDPCLGWEKSEETIYRIAEERV